METKTKDRGWVKNAAIIFLAVLLILTFFSNTILNSSLPEVATQNIGGGSITARIRGTGTVTANQNYEVTVEQSRKVKTVMVKQGQSVSAGDVLFVLADMDSAELEQAQDALRQLQKSYQEKLINAAGKDYAKENRDIQLARNALSEAEAERDALAPDPDDLKLVRAQEAVANAEQALAEAGGLAADAQAAVNAARAAADAAQAVADDAQAAVDNAQMEADIAERTVDTAKDAVTDAQQAVSDAQAELTKAQTDLGTKPDSDTIASLLKTAEEKSKALTDAKNALESTMLIYGTMYNWMSTRAEYMVKQTAGYKALPNGVEQRQYLAEKLPTYTEYVKDLIVNGKLFPYDTKEGWLSDTEYGLLPVQSEITKYTTAYDKVAAARTAVDTAQAAYDAAQAAYDKAVRNSTEFTTRDQRVDAAKAELDAANEAYRAAQQRQREAERAQTEAGRALTRITAGLTEAKSKASEAESKVNEARGKQTEAESKQSAAQEQLKAAQDALKEQQRDGASDYAERVKTAETAVRTAQKNLEDLVFSLQEQQKSDDRQARLDALDMQDLTAQIAKQQQLVEELGADAADKEIKASVGGVIESLGITAGQTTTPGTALATIQLPDMGYGLSFSVTNDQARRVHAGDAATAANIYWGNQIDAVLTTIKTDPKDPQNSKVLSFEVNGDVTPGTSLTLSVGQRSAEYDFVVPNSAIRSDSNGDFILTVVAKNSPLGDRYTATRVNVTKLASDDTSTAVTGALNAGDFVITTSTAPIKNGDRVRLADTQSGG